MNEVSPLIDISRPTLISPAVLATIETYKRACRSEGDDFMGRPRFSISQASAPTAAEIEDLRELLCWINRWLEPAGVDAIRKHVSLAIGMLWLKNEVEADLKVRKDGYLYALSKYPLFAVEAACGDYALRGEDGRGSRRDLAFMPPVPKMCEAARFAMRSQENLRADIKAILDAKIIVPRVKTPDAQARVAADHRTTVASIAEGTARELILAQTSEAGRRAAAAGAELIKTKAAVDGAAAALQDKDETRRAVAA